jgi:MFS family permease
MNHIGLVTGLAVAFWVGYGMSFWTTGQGFDLAWRLSIAVQFIPAVIFMVGLPFVPETPRWLLEKEREDDARKSLVFLRGVEQHPESVEAELTVIKENIKYHKLMSPSSWTVLFTDRDLFARLWRVALLQFMAQMCGATAMKYYLPANFLALGLSKSLSLLASGIESTLKIGCTIIEVFMIDRLGRKGTLLLGSGIMSVALLVCSHLSAF